MIQKFALLFCALLLFSACENTDEENIEIQETMTPVEDSTTIDAHNSQNAVDWPGRYTGVLPCGDCEGILTEIELKGDNTFELKTSYLGTPEANEFIESGTFKWNETGSEITLKGLDYDTKTYKVGENKLWQLDLNGNKIDGDLADHYILKKK